MANYENIFTSEAFQKIPQHQRELFVEMARHLTGKKGMEAMMVVMEYNKKLNLQNMSTEHKKLMMEAIRANMTEEEARKMNDMMKMMETMKMRI